VNARIKKNYEARLNKSESVEEKDGRKMSKLEKRLLAELQKELQKKHISVEGQTHMPLDDWPWKKPRSRQPKCDAFLPQANIYIEIKGFMTIYAMAKMSWLCRCKKIRYYIFQGTEEDWNPYLQSPLLSQSPVKRTTEQNITQQIQELVHLIQNDPDQASKMSLCRLKDYMRIRIAEYQAWNGEWY
jgi:hypothetical protein